jgi:hypothetical protein
MIVKLIIPHKSYGVGKSCKIKENRPAKSLKKGMVAYNVSNKDS